MECALEKPFENGGPLNETIPCQSSKEGVTTMELFKDPKEFVGALYGTLLGDSNIDKPAKFGGFGEGRLRFGHSNKDYAEWKAELFGLKAPVFINNGTWATQSPRTPIYTSVYAHMYYTGRKTVTEHVMKVLSPLGLALLYMDDGDFHKDKQDVKISTCNFNMAEHELMQKGLFKRFGLRFNIHPRRTKIGNKVFYFRLKNSDRVEFFSMIKNFIPICMEYKVPTAEGAKKIVFNSRMNVAEVDSILTKDILVDLYINKNYSIYKMSEHLGVNSGTILGRLRKLGIEIRNSGLYTSSRYSLNLQATEGASRND